MEVLVENNIYIQAQQYAEKQGTNISSLVENFLLNYIFQNEKHKAQDIPDIVVSLLGACEYEGVNEVNEKGANMELKA